MGENGKFSVDLLWSKKRRPGPPGPERRKNPERKWQVIKKKVDQRGRGG